MNTTCKNCGKDLPPPHIGRGKQKTFCSVGCQKRRRYRQRNPHKVLNSEKRGPAPELRLSVTQRAWLAGFWEGEGYIGLGRRTKRAGERPYFFPLVWVFNTNKVVIDHVLAMFGKPARSTLFSRPNGPAKHKPVHTVKVGRASMQAVLEGMLPYLAGKRRQAELVIEFCKISDRCYVREYPVETYERMW